MITENIENILKRIEKACERSGRPAKDVTLVAVAKTFSAAAVREAVTAGVADIGENYVQELTAKSDELAGETIRWHFIGHLQRNKVRDVINRIFLLHSIDSLRLGEEIARRTERTLDVLVEVNTSGETSKFGVRPEETVSFIEKLSTIPGISVKGLMTIGPFLPDPEQSRPAFRLLRTLRERAAEKTGAALPHLSMGMTNDFEVAIDEGATLVRIGTAIFGERHYG